MLVTVLIPIWYAVSSWRSQRQMSERARDTCALLSQWKHELRTEGGLSYVQAAGHGQLLQGAVDRGFRCASALADGIVGLRATHTRAEKANRLRLIWIVRLSVVVVIAALVRSVLLGPLPAFFGYGQLDNWLMLLGALLLLAMTRLFLDLVPALTADHHGVHGFHDWLWHRILVENGCLEASMQELIKFEQVERGQGVSLRAEKLEVLAAYWQARLVKAEEKTELAAEWLPVFEFIGFGLFLVLSLTQVFAQSVL